METVSASDFVRRFGEWQERATHTPVYIRHHGRPRFVLASVELMQSLIERQGGTQDFAFARDALLDVVENIVILADPRLCVVGMSSQARHYFGDPDWRGKAIADLFPDTTRAILMRSAERVLDSSLAESFEVRAGQRGLRRLDVTIQPFADGVALLARDRSVTEERIERAAITDALRETIGLLGDVAILRLNLRGYIDEANASIQRITGLSPETLESVRLVTLFEIGSRAAVGEAIEQAIRHIEPRVVTARLAVNRGESVEVRVAVSAEGLRSSVEAVIVAILVSPRHDALPDT